MTGKSTAQRELISKANLRGLWAHDAERAHELVRVTRQFGGLNPWDDAASITIHYQFGDGLPGRLYDLWLNNGKEHSGVYTSVDEALDRVMEFFDAREAQFRLGARL